MKKMVEDFGGDYRVMRVCFANANPLDTFIDLHDKISYRMFIKFLEYLDAKQTLDFEANEASKRKAAQFAADEQRKANRGV